MREPFFRFDIHNFRGLFHIRMGCSWDSGRKCHYIPLRLTAFGTLYPGIFESETHAQKTVSDIKDFLTYRRAELK